VSAPPPSECAHLQHARRRQPQHPVSDGGAARALPVRNQICASDACVRLCVSARLAGFAFAAAELAATISVRMCEPDAQDAAAAIHDVREPSKCSRQLFPDCSRRRRPGAGDLRPTRPVIESSSSSSWLCVSVCHRRRPRWLVRVCLPVSCVCMSAARATGCVQACRRSDGFAANPLGLNTYSFTAAAPSIFAYSHVRIFTY
jgi:hypothetical protein